MLRSVSGFLEVCSQPNKMNPAPLIERFLPHQNRIEHQSYSDSAPAQAALAARNVTAWLGNIWKRKVVLNEGGINEIGFEISQSRSLAPGGGVHHL